jgi:alkanesulfonate monooxygenase SsuD/methylene tetrahydromethanopterin reductase-like flavin-dependent oxidoreductase (luciferase family)
MRICLMIEGQEGVTWEEWVAIAQTAERCGYEALFRSDHYLSVMSEGTLGALDAWATLAGLATVTSTLRLGTLVSPATFRHPAVLAKNAVTVDHISGGRVELGIGAGWNQGEHDAFGFDLPRMRERFDRFAEQVEIVYGLLSEGEFAFEGHFYTLAGVDAQPGPVNGRLPIVLGGKAGPRAAALAARFADEYNVLDVAPDECREIRERLDDRLTLSLMTGLPDFGPEQRDAYAEAGVERVMLQHLDHADLGAIEGAMERLRS